MQTAPIIPDTAPFTAEQRAWLNGFLAGVLARGPMEASVQTASAVPPVRIVFGSQTGTAEGLAKRAAKLAVQRGFAPTVSDMSQVDLPGLAQDRNLLVITSTYGEGEPPDNAQALHSAIAKAEAPSLSGLRFSVCGLGDTNYVRFCQAAKDFDSGIERLGGHRAFPRVDCDLDYEAKFDEWLRKALEALLEPGAAPAAPAEARVDLPAQAPVQTEYGRKNPFPAVVATTRPLNGPGSLKQVQHVEFNLDGSGLAYEPGDALGVWPKNCPELADDILAALGCDGEEAVSLANGTHTSFRCALIDHCDLGRPSPELAARFAAPSADLHVVDLILARPETRLKPTELVRLLKPLAPRLYSISSSPRAHAGQVHLTVGAVRYEAHNRLRKGVCSNFLAERVVPGETRVGVFVHSNSSFRLPASSDVPVIMVGPGTGIAPFRAFLHERRSTGAKGKSWLFFGDQHAASDFLYQEELLAFRNEGVLTCLDTAFSRDQESKIYVQHRMVEQARELYSWLESGAHFYVCGDASRMAKDVDAALHRIVAAEGSKTPDQAADYVQALRSSKRYARDVY